MDQETIYELTRDFLQDFFETTKYFNIEEIAQEATPKIQARMETLKKYYGGYSIIFQPPSAYEEEHGGDYHEEYYEIRSDLANMFV